MSDPMTHEELVAGLIVIRTTANAILKELVPSDPPEPSTTSTSDADCKHETVQDVSGAGGATRKVCVDCKQEVS